MLITFKTGLIWFLEPKLVSTRLTVAPHWFFATPVLRRDDGHVLRKALEFEMRGKRKRGRPKKRWKTQVEKESKSVGLEKKDAMNRARWKVGVREIAAGVNLATPVYGDKLGSKLD